MFQGIAKDPVVFRFANGTTIDNPLFIVDGKIVSKKEFNQLSPDNIENLSVLKNKSAIQMYGEQAKNGVIIITTKKKVEINTKIDTFFINCGGIDSPLIIMDDKIISDEEFEINPDMIKELSILKDKTAIEMYGEQGKNGVIIITSKKTLPDNESVSSDYRIRQGTVEK
jgi:TonB-dependent SusC/RagA subfamily outer membrane receptor